MAIDYLLGVIDEPVPYYDKAVFLFLPNNMSNEESRLLKTFLDYLEFKRKYERL